MKTAMLLAAGRAERLRPLSDRLPKALCQCQGKPLIEHHVVHLIRAGFERIIINHAYLGGQIRQHFRHKHQWEADIIFSAEPPGGLETGGGLAYALPLIGNDPFLAINADVFSDYPFKNLRLEARSLGNLVLVPNTTEHAGDFSLTEEGYLSNEKRFIYSGIACYDPLLFKEFKIGRYSVTPILRNAAAKQQLTGEVYQGQWFDTGTPERLLIADKSKCQAAINRVRY